MTNSRIACLILLVAVSTGAPLPAFAGQVSHQRSVHVTRVTPSAVVHQRRPVQRTVVTHVSRVRVRGNAAPRTHTVVAVPKTGEVIVVRPAPAVVSAPAAVAPEGTAHRWGTSIAAETAILAEPSPDAKVIKHVQPGTHIPDIIGEQNGYYAYIRWTHKIAYVAKSDVRLGDGAAVVDGTHNGEPGH